MIEWSMASPTRTLNPLPFGDLEPKRFEDLIRQLAYEFKNWRRLEATGRSGRDDGFDARGYEIASDTELVLDSDNDGDEENLAGLTDRLWLIQCKRESRIGPAKLLTYLKAITPTPDEKIYGIVFAAACDFSKQSRDSLAQWCRDNGVDEWHVWGRSELEDMLFQPRFDHLLFAYFGISLSIRRRTISTELRRQIAIKRKLKRFLDGQNDGLVLLRDIDGKDYPDMSMKGDKPRFRVRRADSLTAYGLKIKVSMREAWLSANGEEWDVALASWGNAYAKHDDPWNQPNEGEDLLNELASDAWQKFPDNEKAWLYVEGIIPYDQIVLIDDIGDDEFSGPHVFVSGWDSGYQLTHVYLESIDYKARRRIRIDQDARGRIAKFPEETRPFIRKRWGY
jgi:hypothetical protein